MRLDHWYRQLANTANGSTQIGLAVARLGRARIVCGPRGLLLAGGYRLRFPTAAAFTVGNVILTRLPLDRLVGDDRLLAHEERHSWQYVALGGPFYWPVYLAATGWSWLRTGDRGSGNVFERLAGLTDGGYDELPTRPLRAVWPAVRAGWRRRQAQRAPAAQHAPPAQHAPGTPG